MCDHVRYSHDHHVLQSGWVGGRCTPPALQTTPPPRSTPAPSIAVLFVAPELYGKNILDNTKHNITQLEETHFGYLLALRYVYIVVRKNIDFIPTIQWVIGNLMREGGGGLKGQNYTRKV